MSKSVCAMAGVCKAVGCKQAQVGGRLQAGGLRNVEGAVAFDDRRAARCRRGYGSVSSLVRIKSECCFNSRSC